MLSALVCAEVLVICLWVLLAFAGMHHHVPSRLIWLKQRSFPASSCVVSMVAGTMTASDFSLGALPHFAWSAYSGRSSGCGTADRVRSLLFHRLLSQHPTLPTPEGSSRLHSRVFAASFAFAFVQELGSLFSPFGPTFRCCKLHVKLRAIGLHPFRRGIRRFSTSGCPAALDACSMAFW